jgi:SAM-dependent MidA family methyltransferase
MSALNNLAERLRARIQREGPISFYEWMKAALYDERAGYYCRADLLPQGRTGDYRTAPETSPLFAAAFAEYIARLHTDLKWPGSWTILEMGSGGGEFAHGFLSHLRTYMPEIYDATSYVISEVGAAARSRASHRLSEFHERISFRRFDEIVDTLNPGIIFSNELIDAFPVHRVVMRGGELRELCVGVGKTGFTWIECDLEPDVAEYCRRAKMQLDEDQIAEVNLQAEEFVARAAALLNRGYLITVDYGAEREELWRSPDRRLGTLRGFHGHQLVDDVLARPGEQDLTTTIDWSQIREAGERAGLRTIRYEPLDKFLETVNVLQIMALITSQMLDSVEQLRMITSARELILPTGLAASFQVLVQEKVATT